MDLKFTFVSIYFQCFLQSIRVIKKARSEKPWDEDEERNATAIVFSIPGACTFPKRLHFQGRIIPLFQISKFMFQCFHFFKLNAPYYLVCFEFDFYVPWMISI